MEKPDVDSIDGLSPAISIDQKTTSRNPRSTVGTVTEIYDYLRLLFARVGHPHCHVCGRPIAGQSAEQIVDQVMALPEPARASRSTRRSCAAARASSRTCSRACAARASRASRSTARRGCSRRTIDLDKKFKHDIAVVVDRLIMKDDLRKRLADSVETALALADGLIDIAVVDGETTTYSEKFACPEHGVSLPELAPRVFSFNSPHGACPACHGLGATPELDPDMIVPDAEVSISERRAAALERVRLELLRERHPRRRRPLRRRRSRRPGASCPTSSASCSCTAPDGQRVLVTYRNRQGRKRQYMMAFEGIVAGLDRRYRETES